MLHAGFYPLEGNEGYSLVAVCRLLIAVASLVEEDGLQGMQASVAVAHGFNSCGSRALKQGSFCGIFPDQGSKSCLLHWRVDSLPLSYQGSPKLVTFDELHLE